VINEGLLPFILLLIHPRHLCENVPILEEIFLHVLTSAPALESEPNGGRSFSTPESMAVLLGSVLKC
jgi:hypothetical protein